MPSLSITVYIIESIKIHYLTSCMSKVVSLYSSSVSVSNSAIALSKLVLAKSHDLSTFEIFKLGPTRFLVRVYPVG